MNCTRTERGDLDAYVHGELSPSEARSVEAHLFACTECVTELRYLRAEKRFFRMRAEMESDDVPPFDAVLARIANADAPSMASAPKPLGTKGRATRAADVMQSFPRRAQAVVAMASMAAVVATFLGLTRSGREFVPAIHTDVEAMEIGSTGVCPNEDDTPAEPLVSMPPRSAIKTDMTDKKPKEDGICAAGSGASESCAEATTVSACGETIPWCGETF